jgi:DNA ligase-associated metallophosphoesterase
VRPRAQPSEAVRASDAAAGPAARGPGPDDGVAVAGVSLVGDPTGAIYWPEQGLLAVADLHLEKGSSLARRGVLLPPYDTAATLSMLALVIAHYAPRMVVMVGDSFHDRHGAGRLMESDRASLRALQRGRDWMWIAGNHDPDPVADVGGQCAEFLRVGPLTFRHEPRADAPEGEIAGHLHPLARLAWRGRMLRRRCFAGDGRRLVMPAFGAYTGGLNIRDRAFADVFGTLAFTAHMLGEHRLFPISARHCRPD